MCRSKTAQGFSLVELMVTVGIIAIMAGVAAPMYTAHVRKTRADEGQAALMLIKAKQELYRSTRFTYAASLADLPGYTAAQEHHGDYFMVEIEAADANSFTARAWDGAGERGISGDPGEEEWKITQDMDKPCRTKTNIYEEVDPCVAENNLD